MPRVARVYRVVPGYRYPPGTTTRIDPDRSGTAYRYGTGTGQPLGLIAGAALNNQAAVGSTTLIKYADLVATTFKVDPAYRQGGNCKWMWSDTALSTIRQLVDGQQRPLF